MVRAGTTKVPSRAAGVGAGTVALRRGPVRQRERLAAPAVGTHLADEFTDGWKFGEGFEHGSLCLELAFSDSLCATPDV